MYKGEPEPGRVGPIEATGEVAKPLLFAETGAGRAAIRGSDAPLPRLRYAPA